MDKMDKIKSARRIAIIGNAGSGKSTLTSQLHRILGLPAYHLDKYFWKPNWVRPDLREYEKIHDNLCNQEYWITDGINLRYLEYRMQRAQTIIFLDVPRWLCVWRAIKRAVIHWGKEIPSNAPGCHQSLDWEFLKFLQWIWNFENEYKPYIVELLEKYKTTKTIYILKTPQEVQEFLES